MNKLKHIVLALATVVSVSFSFMASSVDAANVELSKQFIKDWKSGKQTFAGLSEVETRQQTYEDESMSVLIQPVFHAQTLWSLGGVRRSVNSTYDNTVFVVDQGPLGGTAGIFSVNGVYVTVENKTDQVMIIDLNKSAVSLGSYYGRPISAGVKYTDMQTANLAPMLIPPKGRVSQEWFRGDYTFVANGENSEWVHPSDLILRQNIFGGGAFILSVGNDTNAHYVTMPVCMIFTEDSLRPYIRQKK